MAHSCLSNPPSLFCSGRKLLKKRVSHLKFLIYIYIYILRDPICFCIPFLSRAVVICLWWKHSSQFIDDIHIWGHIMLWKPFQSPGPICPTKMKKKKIKAVDVGFLYFLSTLYILTHCILTTFLLSLLYKLRRVRDKEEIYPRSYLVSGEPGIWTQVSIKFMHCTIPQYYTAPCTLLPLKFFICGCGKR